MDPRVMEVMLRRLSSKLDAVDRHVRAVHEQLVEMDIKMDAVLELNTALEGIIKGDDASETLGSESESTE
jgi:hypothetical protein